MNKEEGNDIIKHLEFAKELICHSQKIHPMVAIRNERRIAVILKELRDEFKK